MTRPMMDGRYSGVAITLHWVIALLVIVNMIVGLGHDAIPALGAWMPGHKAIGMTVLVLTFARLAWRLVHRAPPLPVAMPGWEKAAAHATHWALYALLVLMPVTGWMMVSGTDKRRPFEWFGLFDLPYLPISKAAGGIGHSGHGLLGWAMLVLVVLHVAAALRHHLILRDGLLARMIPALGR